MPACMTWDFLAKKKVGIWGTGKEGMSAQRAISFFAPTAQILPFNDDDLTPLFACEAVVLSPGVSIYRPEVLQAREKGILFTSGTNLFLENKPPQSRVLAVTGTKGKSTTASLVYQLLSAHGLKCALGGNIGKPLLDFLFDAPQIIVAELSSYQCAGLSNAVDGALLINLYPEHLQWHQTHERYYQDKINLIRQAHKKIVNAQNEEIKNRLPDIKEVAFFNTPDTWHIEGSYFYKGKEKLFPTSVLSLKGAHNALNACAALALLEETGFNIDLSAVKQAFSQMKALDHRLQPIGEYGGLTFVDDSISTTPQSTIAALKTYENSAFITLIAGGFDRGQDYAPLIDYIAPLKEKFCLITLPDTGKRLHESAQKAGIQSVYATTMETAVREAYARTQTGGAVLLSPAAPSYNAYKNFEERGKDFSACVINESTSF